jgi:dTDP-4-amino-4,6-dideoxy-D-galactose acyltransferase
VELLEWDTNFFGIPIGRATVDDPRDLQTALDTARDRSVRCLYVVVPGAKTTPLAAAIDAGGVLTALRLELEYAGPPPPAQANGVRRALADDAAHVERLAAALAPTSRFARDDRFPPERIEEMYRIWVRADLRNEMVLIDRTGERGLVALSRQQSGLAIDLVYVDDAARGTGLGRQLVGAAVGEAGSAALTVVTDVRNVPAVRLYESAGFRARSVGAILHLWRDDM